MKYTPVNELYDQLEKEIETYIKRIESGDVIGLSLGFEKLDQTIGRIEPGNIGIIGGYNGTGKSFFVNNLMDGMCAKNPNITITTFTTELNEIDYIRRHILMRSGIYRNQLLEFRDNYIEAFKVNVQAFFDERRLNPFSQVVNKINKFEDIEQWLSICTKIPDVIFIDWIQQLSVTENKKTYYRKEETMPIIAYRIDKLREKFKCAVIAISQINNYMVNSDSKINKLAPFAYGNDLNSLADFSAILSRRRQGGQSCKVLELDILKARDGDPATVCFEIKPGYKLEELSGPLATILIQEFENQWNK